MKTLSMLLVITTLLTACSQPGGGNGGATTPTENPGSPSPAAPKKPGIGGSIGTVGGGGTLNFSFRHGALLAKKLMESTGEVTIKDPLNDSLNRFYLAHRARWISALNDFAERAEIISETSESLSEHGLPVGALALPETAPIQVVLSVPYLTGKDGFGENKAISLAIHEAGHFAVLNISETEHKYLDQIAALLTWKRADQRQVRREVRVPFDSSRGTMELTSDGLHLVQFANDYSIEVKNLETGWVEKLISKTHGHTARGYLGEDWVKVTSDERVFQIRNLLTNQRVMLDMNRYMKPDESMENARHELWVRDSKLYLTSSTELVVQDLNTNQVIIKRLPFHEWYCAGENSFSESLTTMARWEGNAVSFIDLKSGSVIDYAPLGNWSGFHFIDENHVLLSDSPSNDNYRHRFLKNGTSRMKEIEAGRYLGRDKTSLWFINNPMNNLNQGDGILVVDPMTLEQKVVNFPGNQRWIIGGRNAGGNFLLGNSDGRVVLFNLARPDRLDIISTADAKERPELYTVTAMGRVAVTRTMVEGREAEKVIVRFLDK